MNIPIPKPKPGPANPRGIRQIYGLSDELWETCRQCARMLGMRSRSEFVRHALTVYSTAVLERHNTEE